MDRVASRYVNGSPEAAAAWAAAYASNDSAANLIEEVGAEWAKTVMPRGCSQERGAFRKKFRFK